MTNKQKVTLALFAVPFIVLLYLGARWAHWHLGYGAMVTDHLCLTVSYSALTGYGREVCDYER